MKAVWKSRPVYPRLVLMWEPRDLWVGCFVARDAIYVALIPVLVFRWRRGR